MTTRGLRAYAEVSLGRQRSPAHDAGPFMVKYLRAANVKDGYLDLSDVKEMNFEPKEQTIFALRPGDVLVTEGSGSLSAVGASSVWYGEIEGLVCFQNTLLRLRPRTGTDPRFLAWWCRHAFADGLFASVATGANIYHISAERVRGLPMALLPLVDQRTIADYLDAETARIDALIAKKQRLIAALDERRDALALDAVSGASIGGPRRPSGLDWIGSIPTGWDTPPLYARYDVLLGRMLNAERSVGGDQRPYLRNINVRWLDLDLNDVATMDFPEAERARYRLRAGDLLICEGGAGYARAAVWDGRVEEMYFQKSLHRVRSVGGWPVRWLAEFLRAGKAAGAFAAQGNLATIPHLTAEQLRAHRIPMPPSPEEAVSIIEEIDRQAVKLAQTIDRVTRQLDLLDEHRQALITAAVTGQ